MVYLVGLLIVVLLTAATVDFRDRSRARRLRQAHEHALLMQLQRVPVPSVPRRRAPVPSGRALGGHRLPPNKVKQPECWRGSQAERGPLL